jgi:UrcA family protein
MRNLIRPRRQLPKFLVAAGFFALGCATICGTALAQQPMAGQGVAEHISNHSSTNGSVTYPVGYSDLDISKMKGAKILYLRIRYAAEVLCESAATWGRKDGQACVNRAVNDAVAQINRPLLSHYHQLRTQGDKATLVHLARTN